MKTTIVIDTTNPRRIQDILLREKIPYKVKYEKNISSLDKEQLTKDFILASKDPDEQKDLQDWSILESENWNEKKG